MKVFFGKFAKSNEKFEQQIEERRYYSKKGSSWFNGISEGDYCYILAGTDVYLWQAKKYINDNGIEYLQFDAVIENKLPMDSNQFKAFKYFFFNPQNIVLSSRQVRSKGFFEVSYIVSFDEDKLKNIQTYQNKDNYRAIYVVDLGYEKNDKDIYLIKEDDGYRLHKSSFIVDETYNSFVDNTKKRGTAGKRSNKDSTIDKITKTEINSIVKGVNMLPFYDLFFNKYKQSEVSDEEQSVEVDEYLNPINKNPQPLNQILYGPPGTGKTYHTVKAAVDICRTLNDKFSSCDDHQERHEEDCYDCAKEAYKQLKGEGRIEFVTFHQSYGYEEFIEGIRAETIEGEDGTSFISYDVKPGVFKRIASLAEKNISAESVDGKKTFSDVFQESIKTKVSSEKRLEIKMVKSSLFIKEVTERTIFFDKRDGESNHSLSIKTLQKIYEEGQNNIISGGLQSYYEALLKYLNENSVISEPSKKKNYVLIIDEINRGNMSKIFGELITLIEEDKRIGGEHEMRTCLPNSRSEFGVSNNLHIIGTMNTADRSIAMMDTALRRRFEFKEMMPNPCLLHESNLHDVLECTVAEWEDLNDWDFDNKKKNWEWDKDYSREDILIDNVNLRRMLYTINQRIEVLYDREHTIGHAYFMGLKSGDDITRLASVIENQIIPLLAEYFFEDWKKIRLVLGDNLKGEASIPEFIKKVNGVDSQKLFGGDLDDFHFDERTVYERNPNALENPASYVAIYDIEEAKKLVEPDKKG